MNKDSFHLHDSENDFSTPDGMENKNPFIVPENYFDQLPLAIVDRIREEKAGNTKWISGFRMLLRPQISLAIAAMLLIVFLGIRFGNQNHAVQIPEREISMTEIENSGYVTDLDEFLLAEILDQQWNENPQTDDFEVYKQYLLDNDIDLTLLENKL